MVVGGEEKNQPSFSFVDQFNEMTGVSSPLVLLRSIVEQLASVDVNQAIVLVLKRFRMFDHRVPQVIEQFFPDNFTASKAMDKVVDVRPTLVEEASQERIVTDDTQLLDAVSIRVHLSTSIETSCCLGVSVDRRCVQVSLHRRLRC